MTGCLARMFGGEIPRVPGAVKKNTCLTVYIVLLGYYRIFESMTQWTKSNLTLRLWEHQSKFD